MGKLLKWNRAVKEIAAEKLKKPGSLKYMASEAKRLMDPYVPANNLVLAQNVQVGQEGDSGYVKYLSPYAHYQYAGVLYVSSVTGSAWSRGEYKVKTGRRLKHSTFRHPLATSVWNEAMMRARKDDLAGAVQQYVESGGTGV